jgi:hypothetical protein
VRSRVLLFIPLFVLALPLLTGCSGKLSSAAAVVQAATRQATQERSVAFEMRVSVDGVEGLDALAWELRMQGAVDLDARMAWMTFGGGGSEIELRAIDGTTYTRFMDEGWVATAGEFMDARWEELVPLSDPFAPLRDFGVTSGDFEFGGTEEVHGREAERYSAVVDASDLAADAYPFHRSTGPVALDVWVDENGWPMRLSVVAEVDPADLYAEEVEASGPVTFTVTIDYFDYGKPVEVEKPADDEIMSLDDLGNSPWGGGDPFEDAECYGDRLAECLQPNPEADALAVDPALCQGAVARLCLVPVGWVRLDVVEAIVDFHRETKGIEVLVLPGVPLTSAQVDTKASQVTTQVLWALLEEHYGVNSYTPSTFIAMTAIDARDGEFGWLFGSRWGGGPFGHNHGVFSYFRMAVVPPYDGSPLDDGLLHERVAKYAARYTALLHLDYPIEEDINYLNYYEMYGFSDLDSMRANWPTGPQSCLGQVICVILDGSLADPAFERDMAEAVKRLESELGVRVDLQVPPPKSYYMPTLDSWSEEFGDDLRATVAGRLVRPGPTIVGVTDNRFANAPAVTDHVDRAWPEENLGVISGYDAGSPGTPEHRERLYRLLYRVVAQAHYGVPLDDDPASLMYRGVQRPKNLDGTRLPALP